MAVSSDNAEQDAHRKWKHLAAPMYDWMTNHHLVWPGLACRFGQRHQIDNSKYSQVIYYSDQVGSDDKASNKLIKQHVEVLEEGYSPMDHINTWKENQKSPYFGKRRQIINHPGECNRIMEVKQMDDMVVTHSDCEEVFVWDFSKQPGSQGMSNKQRKAVQRNTPDLRLTGHTEAAPFALSASSATPTIASGGEDKTVLLWNLEDYGDGALLSTAPGTSLAGEGLAARTTFRGHTNTITCVAFKPGSDSTLVSTSDDHVIKLWDTRQSDAVQSVAQAAELDVLSVDWSGEEHYIATGADGGKLHVYDVRKLAGAATAAPLLEFQQFTRQQSAVLTVAFSPRQKTWLLSSGNDGRVSVFDTTRTQPSPDGMPPQLVMQHIGHIGNIMDAQWSPHEDFMVMSVSNDGETYKEGGALQLWRMSWLLTSPFELAEAELKTHQKWLETGKLADLPHEIRKPPQPPAPTEIPTPTPPAQPAIVATAPITQVDAADGAPPEAEAAAPPAEAAARPAAEPVAEAEADAAAGPKDAGGDAEMEAADEEATAEAEADVDVEAGPGDPDGGAGDGGEEEMPEAEAAEGDGDAAGADKAAVPPPEDDEMQEV